MIQMILQILSVGHDSEKASQDATGHGLNPLLQAKVIGIWLFAFAQVAKSIWNVSIPDDMVNSTANTIATVVQGCVSLYGVAMYASDAWYKAHPKVQPMAPAGQAPTGVQVGAPPASPQK
jgi:hypothetical protein